MVLQGPGLHQLEQCSRAPGHERHHLLQGCPLDLAGQAGAALGMGRAIEAGYHLEVRLVLADGIALGVAGARLRAIAEGTFSGGH